MHISFDFSMTKTLATPKLLVSVLQYCLSNFVTFIFQSLQLLLLKKTFVLCAEVKKTAGICN